MGKSPLDQHWHSKGVLLRPLPKCAAAAAAAAAALLYGPLPSLAATSTTTAPSPFPSLPSWPPEPAPHPPLPRLRRPKSFSVLSTHPPYVPCSPRPDHFCRSESGQLGPSSCLFIKARRTRAATSTFPCSHRPALLTRRCPQSTQETLSHRRCRHTSTHVDTRPATNPAGA